MPNDPSEIPICQAQLAVRTASLGIVDLGPLCYWRFFFAD